MRLINQVSSYAILLDPLRTLPFPYKSLNWIITPVMISQLLLCIIC